MSELYYYFHYFILFYLKVIEDIESQIASLKEEKKATQRQYDNQVRNLHVTEITCNLHVHIKYFI